MIDDDEFIAIIEATMKRSGVIDQELASILGVSLATILEWRDGAGLPDSGTRKRYATEIMNAFGIPRSR